MLVEIKQDLFSIVSDAIIAHGCNCQGSMGAGVALTVKNRYNKAYREYRDLCMYKPGEWDILGTTQIVEIKEDFYIANMFTQVWYNRGDGKACATLEAIEDACNDLARKLYDRKINVPVYMPRIGAGLGGLKWDDVAKTIADSDLATATKVVVCYQ